MSDAGDFADPDQREKLERDTDQRLHAVKAGAVIGAGAGLPDTLFIDVARPDVDEAIPNLRDICRQYRLSHNAVLRFYDADWMHEWVGMFEDTPPPDNLDELW